jgi:glyoxylase-like metal-dependent hydrolase (beta-lactamase superfamily II)
MSDVVRIPLPLPHIGSVNAWLLRGEPLTLVDTGPRAPEALAALETGLRAAGTRLEDLQLVLATHHHLDHTGLAATIARRSGAAIAALDRAADYGANYDERLRRDREFSLALMRHHGVPDATIAAREDFWDYLRDASEEYLTDIRLSDGASIRAGGRDLTVLARPGHSTTDAIFVDESARVAFVGDHLLAGISSNTEVYPAVEPDGRRPRARIEYLENLRRTAALPLDRLLTGHGADVTEHAELVHERLAEHDERCDRIVEVLKGGPANAFAIARRLWSPRTVSQQPLLVVWEVLGHLDLLLESGLIAEDVTDDGSRYGLASFALTDAARGD